MSLVSGWWCKETPVRREPKNARKNPAKKKHRRLKPWQGPSIVPAYNAVVADLDGKMNRMIETPKPISKYASKFYRHSSPASLPIVFTFHPSRAAEKQVSSLLKIVRKHGYKEVVRRTEKGTSWGTSIAKPDLVIVAAYRTNQPRARKNPARSRIAKKFERCVKDVKKRGGAYSPYATCTSSMYKKYGKRKTKKALAPLRRRRRR